MAPDEPDPPRRGRRTKLTPGVLEMAIRLTLRGNYRHVVARALGVHPATFRAWMRTGGKFPDGIYGRLRRGMMKAEAAEIRMLALITEAARDDAKYACWFLERRWPQRWGRSRGEYAELKRKLARLEKLMDAQDAADSPGE